MIPQQDEYVMFHSPENSIVINRSKDLAHWTGDEKVLTLGQQNRPWAKGRITAGFVVDLKNSPTVKSKYCDLMFFQGSKPLKETEGDFDRNASIGSNWSNDLKNWDWKTIIK